MNKQRKNIFKRWWKNNHHNINAHVWLTKQSKRVIHNYNVAPEQYTYTQTIIKRFNCSQFKRLSCKDAEYMWRLTHPSLNERRKRLLATAIFLQQKVELSGRTFSK